MMNERRAPWSWWAAPVLAVVLGIGSQLTPVVPSPGRSQGDAAQAVYADSAWVLDYLVTQPRTGDRIADSLYLALLEGEDRWTGAYLERQHTALVQAVASLSGEDTEAHNVAALTLQTLEHYQKLIAAGHKNHDGFQCLRADQIGPQLRQRAVAALDRADR